MTVNDDGCRYYLTEGGPEREVTKAEFVAAERRAGFRNTMGEPDEPATAGFSGPDGQVRGRVEYGGVAAERQRGFTEAENEFMRALFRQLRDTDLPGDPVFDVEAGLADLRARICAVSEEETEAALARFRAAVAKMDSDPAEQVRIAVLAREDEADGALPARTAAFTPAGSVNGIALVQHLCPGWRGQGVPVAYVSAQPSPPGDEYRVPGCGCRPEQEQSSGT